MQNDTETLNRIMPTSPHVQALADRLRVPTLDALAYALRHRDTWPAGFVWDYSHCETCAMGLTRMFWNQSIFTLFDIPMEARANIFGGAGRPSNTPQPDVTPEMVADAIDAYLAQPARA